jgi:hypothetical protein
MKMNKRIIYRLERFFANTKNAHLHRQSSFIRGPLTIDNLRDLGPEARRECNTTACMAGWTMAFAPRDAGGTWTQSSARVLLGLATKDHLPGTYINWRNACIEGAFWGAMYLDEVDNYMVANYFRYLRLIGDFPEYYRDVLAFHREFKIPLYGEQQ